MTKISQYTTMTTLQAGDLLDISEDLGGSYGSRSITYTNLLTNLNNDLTGMLSLGLTTQVPYVNAGATDLDYSANLTFTGTLLTLTGTAYIPSENELRLGSAGVTYNAFKSPAVMAVSKTYTLPATTPTANGQVLSSTTAGVMTWADNTEPIVKYVVNETELIAAFADFNTSGVSGIIKLGADVTLTANRTFDFDLGIEVWGGNNSINLGGASAFVITVNGTRGVFRGVNFVGNLDFSTGVIDSQHFLDFNDTDLALFTFSECYFSSVVGDINFVGTAAYPITVTSISNGFWLEIYYTKIGTTRTGAGTKPYDAFRINYTAGAVDAFKISCRDWTNYAPASVSQATRWQESKDSMVILVDITGSLPTGKRGFYYDETTTFDATSTFAMDLFPTFWGPTTKIAAVDPTAVATFGNPGDLLINSATIYMKHTAIGTDTNWSQIN